MSKKYIDGGDTINVRSIESEPDRRLAGFGS